MAGTAQLRNSGRSVAEGIALNRNGGHLGFDGLSSALLVRNEMSLAVLGLTKSHLDHVPYVRIYKPQGATSCLQLSWQKRYRQIVTAMQIQTVKVPHRGWPAALRGKLSDMGL
jgi:hypothetical protein